MKEDLSFYTVFYIEQNSDELCYSSDPKTD